MCDSGWWQFWRQLAWRFLTAHRRLAPNQSLDCIPQVIFGEVGVTQGRFNSLVAHEHLHGAAGCVPSPAGWQRCAAGHASGNLKCLPSLWWVISLKINAKLRNEP
jgi:hypothetical protein